MCHLRCKVAALLGVARKFLLKEVGAISLRAMHYFRWPDLICSVRKWH